MGPKGDDSPEHDSKVEALEILIGSGPAFLNDWIRLRSEEPDPGPDSNLNMKQYNFNN